MNILRLDKNNTILHLYHKSAKYILPLNIISILSIYNNNKNMKYINYSIQDLNVLNIGFHSYISLNTIATDYIKIKQFENIFRILNTKSHFLATLGFIYYIHKENKD